MILAGDVGGTKTVLGLFDVAADGVRQRHEATFASPEHRSLEDVLATFLVTVGTPALRAACIGVAGPVIDGTCDITNLAWHLDETILAEAVGVPRLKLLNDLEATAYGMICLPAEDLAILNSSRRPKRRGNIAVIAAGTGLGEAMLYWDGAHHHPIASEGGHADFAPRTDREIELLQDLRRELGGRVSCERVLSGPGLVNIYHSIRHSAGTRAPAWLTDALGHGDPSAAISEAALAGTDPVCVETLDLFCSIYGAEAGNLALKCLALGGVFVGGGIAPKILPALRKPDTFMRGFTEKGRFGDLMRSLEVSVALNPRAAVLGAAHYALRLGPHPS